MSGQVFLGKTKVRGVTFVEFPEKRQAMDVPAGILSGETTSRENTCKGHCSRGQKAGISAEDEKTKGHTTP